MQNKPKLSKTFIIRHKETKELFIARSGKSSWKAVGHAKNAFHQSLGYNGGYCRHYGLEPIQSSYYDGSLKLQAPKFDEQNIYEIVELKAQEIDLLGEAILVLKEVELLSETAVYNCVIPDYLKSRVKTFLKGIDNAK